MYKTLQLAPWVLFHWYQPSWQALEALRNSGFIQENGQWQNLPKGVEITSDMQAKCNRI